MLMPPFRLSTASADGDGAADAIGRHARSVVRLGDGGCGRRVELADAGFVLEDDRGAEVAHGDACLARIVWAAWSRLFSERRSASRSSPGRYRSTRKPMLPG
jgi:hypothetical protein